jgi:ParB-like chromosome segregation protein Spo0J
MSAQPVMRLQVVETPVESLIPYARNARTHSDAQVAQIAGSVREFGWTNPILIDEDGGIIAGHARVLAARLLGVEKVPTITLAGLSREQKRAYILADNKLALNAGWDVELLALELGELREFDMSLVGFTDAEIAMLLKSADGEAPSDDEKLYRVIVDCATEQQQEELVKLMQSEGYNCRVLTS